MSKVYKRRTKALLLLSCTSVLSSFIEVPLIYAAENDSVEVMMQVEEESVNEEVEYGIENVPLVHCFLPLSAKKCTSKCDAVTISNNKSDNNDHKVN